RVERRESDRARAAVRRRRLARRRGVAGDQGSSEDRGVPESGGELMSETETRPERRSLPDKRGYFGPFGVRLVPETRIPMLDDLDATWPRLGRDKAFKQALDALLESFAGRPTPITLCERLTASLGGARIVLKREDLLHTGAHKLNNALGQALIARAMGKK